MNHINTKVLSGLAVAAAVAIGAAVWVSNYRKPASGNSEESAYALPELRGHVNDVKSVGIVVAENKAVVTLSNGESGWTVDEKGNYPADTGKLRELLLTLADARLLQEKTANAQRYADLGVEDIKTKDAKGTLITLEGLTKPVQMIVGNTSSHGEGTFIRRPDDAQSWLAQGQISVAREPSQWLDTALTDIASGRIAEIVLSKAQGKTLRLFKQKSGDSNFQAADLPPGRELAALDAAGGLASALSGLALEDVIAGKDHPVPESTPLLNAHYRTFDGVNVKVSAWQQDNKRFASFAATLDQATAEKAIQAEQDKAKADYDAQKKSAELTAKMKSSAPAPLAIADPAKYHQQRLAEINAEIAHLNLRFQGRHFSIPEFKYANMDKSIDDVLKPMAETQKTGSKARSSKKGKH